VTDTPQTEERPRTITLTGAMRRHLSELAGVANPDGEAFWRPENAGEWRCAEAMERRGLLSRQIKRGQQPFALTRAGREAAGVTRVDRLFVAPEADRG